LGPALPKGNVEGLNIVAPTFGRFVQNLIVPQQTFTHHPVFSKFQRWSGEVPPGFEVDFLGTRNRTDFFSLLRPQPNRRVETPEYPSFDDEYFEWIDLLEAVGLAAGRFNMLELGAGFGRWTARAAAAASQCNMPYSLVAVEAEPTHFTWLRQNLQDNGVDLDACRLVEAAVTAGEGKVGFQIGNARNSYGQAIGGETEVDAVSLSNLLSPINVVDLIDLDVQGAEFEILSSSPDLLNRKVKRIHVETHSHQLHGKIIQLFQILRWKPHFLYEGNTADRTPWGKINFQDGTQSWLNPALHSSAQIDETPTLRNSVGWRTVAGARTFIARIAPSGSARRRVLSQAFSRLSGRYKRDSFDVDRRG
jgi:FkbM family methyltransferase